MATHQQKRKSSNRNKSKVSPTKLPKTSDEINQRAEKKIEEALLSGSEVLDLSSHYDEPKLIQLPEKIAQLTRLTSLNLAMNHLTELPASMSGLKNLKSLNLSQNKLMEFPDSLASLTQLQSLNLSNNRLENFAEWISYFPNLESLDLSENKLTAIHETIGQLSQLQSLSLAGNEIRLLPASFGQLTKLQFLDLRGNKLTTLPEQLGQAAQLQTLNVASNQLTVLPEWMGLLVQLKWLDLSNNLLEQLQGVSKQFPHLDFLNLSNNRLTRLPVWLPWLAQLKSLDLSNNQGIELPEGLGQITHLESLRISDLQLVELPEWVGKLTKLRTLGVSGNKLSSLPDWIGDLRELQRIELWSNELLSLPDTLGELTKLEELWLGNHPAGGNPISTLPQSLFLLNSLQSLGLSQCKIKTLPTWLGERQIQHLFLTDNPLDPELAAAYEVGVEAVRRYLRELAKGSRRRFEAKLLVLGDGNEGKTCVSRAVRGLPFQPQVTTRGVDVEQWKFDHPDHIGEGEKEITLNIWDFEGQEINHQTHQFFLTTQALYLIVFKCRDQFSMDRAEYWLDTIRARAPKASVAIVITQCEERTPYVPQDKLQAQYGDLLAEGTWLFPVGCGDNFGVTELQNFLKRSAANLEFMGREWPESFGRAEEALKDKAQDGTPHISRSQLYDLFRSCDIDETIYKDLAVSMSVLGVMTQFPDCPDLRDFIVLQPQWLTKAISAIMEDKELAADKGEIALARMEQIWERNYSGLFPTFHDCMKEFELCYDLEDASRSCLVPLRFGYEKPRIPWTQDLGMKERRVEYKLNLRPPMGLMSRFIVKTHHLMATTAAQPKGVYWHNGVFLRTGSGPLASEALCEFDLDARKLRIRVSAAFPQNLLEQIHGYVKAVFSFFSGLEAQRSYGCMKIDPKNDAEEKCEGVHSESRIYSAIRKQRVLDCEYEFHDVDPQKLIWGFSTFGEYVIAKVASIVELREELNRRPEWAENLTQDIVKLLSWVEEQREKVAQLVTNHGKLLPELKQELELKLHEYLTYTSNMLDDREFTAAPSLISISTKDRSKWNPGSYFKKTYLLTPFCECEGKIHPCHDGQVEFTKDRDWWEKTAPWIARGSKLLTAGLQLAFAGMPLALGRQAFDQVKDHVELMGELTKHMELETATAETPRSEMFEEVSFMDLRGSERHSRFMGMAVARFLEEAAPINYRAREWGSLRRIRMSDNSYRWLCGTCINTLKN